MKFIIIYHDGPSGSSLFASLLEKYDYLNLPFRKFHLSDYVMGVRDLSDKTMQLKFIERIFDLSVPNMSGGVSVKDRNSRKKQIRTKMDNLVLESFLITRN